MKDKIKDELLEKVSGGGRKYAPSGFIKDDRNIPGDVMNGTAICPVCGKRYDPQYPHICNVK